AQEPATRCPASTARLTPVIAEAQSEQRKTTADAISTAVTSRPKAELRASACASSVWVAKPRSRAGVCVKPGETQLTRTPRGPHSPARHSVRLMTPAFAGAYECSGPERMPATE